MSDDADTDTNGEMTAKQSVRRRRPRWWTVLLALVGLVVLMQLVPYGHSYSNPPVKATPTWPSKEVEQLAMDACADCHSNETTWPWYSRIAPGSWLIKKDVDDGRRHLNWSVPCGEAGDAKEAINGGEMPPIQYKILHPGARLSSTEKKTLADGLSQALRDMPGMHECKGGG